MAGKKRWSRKGRQGRRGTRGEGLEPWEKQPKERSNEKRRRQQKQEAFGLLHSPSSRDKGPEAEEGRRGGCREREGGHAVPGLQTQPSPCPSSS